MQVRKSTAAAAATTNRTRNQHNRCCRRAIGNCALTWAHSIEMFYESSGTSEIYVRCAFCVLYVLSGFPQLANNPKMRNENNENNHVTRFTDTPKFLSFFRRFLCDFYFYSNPIHFAIGDFFTGFLFLAHWCCARAQSLHHFSFSSDDRNRNSIILTNKFDEWNAPFDRMANLCRNAL